MDNETRKRLTAIPDNAKEYADTLSEIDIKDIPWDRVPEIKEIMINGINEYDQLWAARILTEWGDDDGYDFLERYVFDPSTPNKMLMPHRLRGYDDTNSQILAAVVGYWVNRATLGKGIEARKKIFKIIGRIITLASSMQFEISGFFWLVKSHGMTEFLPLLKQHLQAIIQHPELQFWKVADCAHLLTQFDPEFVSQTLADHGKTLADFPHK